MAKAHIIGSKIDAFHNKILVSEAHLSRLDISRLDNLARIGKGKQAIDKKDVRQRRNHHNQQHGSSLAGMVDKSSRVTMLAEEDDVMHE